MPYGKSHEFCEIAGKYVSEVSGRDHEVDRVSRLDAAEGHEVGVGLEVIDHLRCKASDVYGVGRRQGPSGLGEGA